MNRCRTKDYNDFSYELNSLKKENKRLSSEIIKVNEILRSMSKEAQTEFFNIKNEIEKNKNKSYEMML